MTQLFADLIPNGGIDRGLMPCETLTEQVVHRIGSGRGLGQLTLDGIPYAGIHRSLMAQEALA